MDGTTELNIYQLERRHLTVLECDLVGSTALAYKLDPEKLRDLMLAYQDSVLYWVEKLDGYFVQFAGDAVWVYFGYPKAHEDDACRAIRAGLGMAKAAGSINLHGETLDVRIGIASGLCVVGNMRQATNFETVHYQDFDNQITAIGDPPNLASRLQTLVQPGSVAVSEETRSLAGNLFEFEDLGFHKIKGFTNDIRVCRVLAENYEISRFLALRPQAQAPLIGRENELKAITALWHESCKGNGQVVYISGEPGIGKSRLVASVAEDIVGSDHPQWWLHCGEHLQGSAFAPVIALIQAQAGFADIDDMFVRCKKLKHRYPGLDDEALYLLSELLSIEEGSKLTAPHMSSSRRRECLYEVLINLIETACKCTPLLFIAEDAHWIDPSTRALLQRITLRSTNLHLLLMITSRTVNDSEKSFIELFNVQSLNIEQLQREDCFTLLNALWEDREVPTKIAEQIVSQTDGVPLFIEDVIFTLLHTAEKISIDAANGKLTVPAKLSDHLMSRIDKLGNSKQVAQIASVVGREFSLAIMETLTNMSTFDLSNKMDTLINAGLVIASEAAGSKNYVFKHTMIRDAAYDSLLIANRKELHSRIADWLVKERPALRQSQPETIAYHYENADAFDLAVNYWRKAGQRSNLRSNYIEASIHLENAYKLIPALAASDKRDRIELDIITAMGIAQAGAGGISGEDTGRLYDKALQLCKTLDYPAEIFPILAGAGSFHFIRSDYEKSLNSAAQSIHLATEKSNSAGLVIGNRLLGAIQFVKGDFDASIESLQTAIKIYDADLVFRRSYTLIYALNHKTTALCYLALANLTIGKLDTALEASQQSLIHAKNTDIHSINCALCYQAAIRHLRGDPADIVHEVAARSLELALKEGYASWTGMSRLVRGIAMIELGNFEEGVRGIQQGVFEYSNVMAKTFLPLAQSILAKGYLATREFDKALEILAKAEALSAQTRQLWYLPEILRLHAEALIHQEQNTAADEIYQKAWTVADDIGAKFWQLKIARSMVENKTTVESFNDSYELLENAISAIDEGRKEPVLRNAIELMKSRNSANKNIQ